VVDNAGRAEIATIGGCVDRAVRGDAGLMAERKRARLVLADGADRAMWCTCVRPIAHVLRVSKQKPRNAQDRPRA
jgi:hypothetical protein